MSDAKTSVLVVEDNEQNMELVEFLLEEAGLSVRKAMDPEAFRNALLGEPADLVLMDMNLPGQDGLALTAELKKTPGWERVPVVALTALAMRGDRERCLDGGCDGYIGKPIDVRTFAASVSAHLRKRSS